VGAGWGPGELCETGNHPNRGPQDHPGARPRAPQRNSAAGIFQKLGRSRTARYLADRLAAHIQTNVGKK
jgi:hypothetical protein